MGQAPKDCTEGRGSIVIPVWSIYCQSRLISTISNRLKIYNIMLENFIIHKEPSMIGTAHPVILSLHATNAFISKPQIGSFFLFASNGALLDLGIIPENVILKQPEDDTVACQLHFDTTKLTGYYLQGVAVTSEARNVEVYYDNGEYIGTAGRSLLKNTEE